MSSENHKTILIDHLNLNNKEELKMNQTNDCLRIKELDIQIQNLNKERNTLIDNYQNEKILSLEWTKECSAKLQINHFFAAGIPKYQIFLSNNAPYCPNTIEVMSLYSENYTHAMIYSSKSYDSGPCFYTSSNQTLINFLNKVQFKSLEYDQNILELLLSVKQIVDSKY